MYIYVCIYSPNTNCANTSHTYIDTRHPYISNKHRTIILPLMDVRSTLSCVF